MHVKKLSLFALVISVALFVAGCGGHSKPAAGGNKQNPALTISSVTLPTGYVGANYTSTTLTASGGSGTGYAWTVSSGSSLPAGITLSAAGVIAGKPTADGVSNFGVTVTDSASATASTQLSMTVKKGVSITTAAALPDGYVGAAYSQTFAASGGSGSGYTWTVASGSTLPGGLTLTSAGVLGGTPAAAGAASFSVTVTDSAQNSATAQFSAAIRSSIAIASAPALPDGYVGSSYSQTLAATGGTGTGYIWALNSGSTLPAGLTLSSAGVISGRPTAAGPSTFSITVTDSGQHSATVQFSATVKAGISVATPPALPTAFVGVPYAQLLQAAGGSGTGYSWSLAGGVFAVRSHARRMAASNGFPDGLTLSSDGWITGTPTGTGTYTPTVIVTDSAGNTASMNLTFTIGTSLVITTPATLPGGHPGDIYSHRFTASGGSGTGYSWTSPDLPGGLELAGDGTLSGNLPAVNTYSFTVTVTDSDENTATGTFSIAVTNELRFTTGSELPGTYVGLNYATSLAAKGGSGAGYSFRVTAGSSLPAGIHLPLSGRLNGTPTTAGTFHFNVTVTDSASNTANADFQLTVGAALTITSAATLPAATEGTAYSRTVAISGGSNSGIVWTLTSGASSLSAVGLSFTDGVVFGTPSTMGTATFSVSVTDDSQTHDSKTFTIAVNSNGPGYALSGRVNLGNACGAAEVPEIQLSIDTNPAKTATTDAQGNYSFADVPDGAYTVTPSISGATSIFYPATMPVTIQGGAIANQNFVASLAYKVSGTVSYAGPETGQIYVWMLPKSCSGFPLGTSISAPGSFTIEGVPPGTYTLEAGIDSLGFGYNNDANAAGTASSDVTVDDDDVTGTAITLSNPTQNSLVAAPDIYSITPSDSGVVITFSPIAGSRPVFGRVEYATSYEVQWAQQSPFPATPSGSKTFAAGGSHRTGSLILNDPALVAGQVYYFRMRGVNQAGNGPWTNYPDKLIVSPSSGNNVTGTVTFDAEPTGPLYVGYYDLTNNFNIYYTRIQNPVSPQPFSLNVPSGDWYVQFAFLDQNNDGMIDRGDVSNIRNADSPAPVTDNMTDQDLDLNTPGAVATVTTSHSKSTNEDGGVLEAYSLYFQVREGNKLPVSVRLMSGPHIIHPVDLGKCMNCGDVEFQYNVSTYEDMPAAGDSYDFLVTYSDGSSETLTEQVELVLDAFAAGLSPSGTSNSSLTPTFTWTQPADPDNYQYQFSLTDSQGNTIWQIPRSNYAFSGFSSLVTSISWGNDPLNEYNPPTVNSLTHGVTYRWQIKVIDEDGNSSVQRTWYKP